MVHHILTANESPTAKNDLIDTIEWNTYFNDSECNYFVSKLIQILLIYKKIVKQSDAPSLKA